VVQTTAENLNIEQYTYENWPKIFSAPHGIVVATLNTAGWAITTRQVTWSHKTALIKEMMKHLMIDVWVLTEARIPSRAHLDKIRQELEPQYLIEANIETDKQLPRAYTGVAIIAKKDPALETKMSTLFKDRNGRHIVVQIERRGHAALQIMGVYMHHSDVTSRRKSMQIMSSFKDGLLPDTRSSPVIQKIILGDFNIDIHKQQQTSKEFKDFVSSRLNFNIVNNQTNVPTFFKQRPDGSHFNQTTIDYILADKSLPIKCVEVIRVPQTLAPDHKLVRMELIEHSLLKKHKQK